MDRAKRLALERAGFRIGDAEDFLELTPEEQRLVELRVNLIKAVRRLREKRGLTQDQLAALLQSSQSRVAKIEAGAADVSLDLLFRGLFAVGGRLSDIATNHNSQRSARRSRRPDLVRKRRTTLAARRANPRLTR